jgi:hypothetical protein
VDALRKPSGRAPDFLVRMHPAAEAIVVHEKISARLREIVEKVNERVAGHD